MSLRVPANPGHLSQFAFDRQLLGKSFCDGGGVESGNRSGGSVLHKVSNGQLLDQVLPESMFFQPAECM